MKRKLNGFLALLLVLIAQVTFAQDITATGTVQDQAGMPVPGVNVLIKGTTTGTQTDIDGRFTLKATQGQTLVFSFLGMKTIEVAASLNMTVRMEDNAVQLEGVVVTALGITREKRSLGYATQKIDGDETNPVPNFNFANQLSGKVSGLQIKNNNNLGGSTNIVIRGYKSVNNNNQALIVVDGVPIDNNLIRTATGSFGNSTRQQRGGTGYDYGNAASDINPNDIESLNVLKGAAATALYGSRAANGAIMITTKKGSRNQNGIGVTFDSSVSVGTVDKKTFVEYQDNYGQGYFGNLFRTTFDIDNDGNPDVTARTNDDASYGPAYDPNLMVFQWDSYIPESPNYRKARPWVKAKNGPITFFQNPFTHSNSIGLNGANEKGNFNMSATHLESTGLLPNSEQKKNSFLGNASYKLTDKLTASFFGNYINTSTLGRNGTGYTGNVLGNFRQWWATNVDLQELRDIYFSTGKNYTWNANRPNNLTPAFWNNPYFERYESYQNDERNRFLGNVVINYQISKWLDAMARVTVDNYSELREERRANGSYADPFGVGQNNEDSGYQRTNRNFSEFNYDFMLNYNIDITSKVNLKGVIGTNLRRQKEDQIIASTSGGLYVPKLYTLSNSVNPIQNPLESYANIAVDGYYASGSLSFNNLLFLDGTFRVDQSSTLPEDNNVYVYPSVSASLVFSDLISQDWLSFGKIRGGFARVGNDAPYGATRDTYAAGTPFGTPIFAANTIANNPNLVPEQTHSYEVGLEMQFLNKRVGFDVSAYRSVTNDQIVDLPLSESTGVTRRFRNIGEIENKGIEVSLNLVPLQSKDFKWEITANWTKNQNEIRRLGGGVTNYQLASLQGGISINATEGQPYGTIQGTDYVLAPDGQKIVDPATGNYLQTGTNDRVIGNFTPDWNGGVNNRFTYKGISLSFLVDAQHGGDVWSLDQAYGQDTGLYRTTDGVNDLGNPVRNPLGDGGGYINPGVIENPDFGAGNGQPQYIQNTIRVDASQSSEVTGTGFGTSSNPTKAYIYDAGYVKLREATLGYTFSKKTLNNTFQELYVGVSGTNIWIIQKNIPDADPEAGLSAGNIQGYQAGVLPTTRTFALNLRAKF